MDKKQLLAQLNQKINQCRRCPLYQGTTHPVSGEGNPDAQIVFIGEGPGFHEDRLGQPFVGQAGQLLDRALAKINLNRAAVWIGNIVKHRPPGNRDPLPEEIKACQPFLDQQIKIIRPKIIATLGRFSLNKFIPNLKISQIHGQARWVNWSGLKFLVLPLYHPAAALRNGQVMAIFLQDFSKIPELLATVNQLDHRNPRLAVAIGEAQVSERGPSSPQLENSAQQADNKNQEQLSIF